MSRPATLRQAFPGLRRFSRAFRPLLARRRWLIFGSFGTLFAEVLFRILEPWPLKFVIDNILTIGPEPAPLPFALDALPPLGVLTLAAVAVVTFAALRALAAYSTTVGFALVGNRVLNDVRNQLYRHLQVLSLRYHTKARSGDLIMRVMGDVGMLKDVAVTAFLPLLGNVVIMLAMTGVMCWLNWRLTLVVALTAPLFVFSAQRKARKIQHVARDQRKREGALATTAAESIGAIRVVQALSLGDTFNETFSQQSDKSLREGVKGKRLAAGLERSVDVIIALATALVLWFGTVSVMDGTFTVGSLLVFLSYLKSTFKPVRNFAKYTARLAKASAAGERVLDVLEEEPEVQDLPDARPAPPFAGRLEFEQVKFAYEPEQEVLNGLSFTVAAAESLAVVGPSGSGKSTTASLLLRLFDPSEGSVRIDGRDIRSWTLASLRSQISIVLQDTLLFAASIRDNIAYGAADADPEEVLAAARLANVAEFAEPLPDGYDTLVGERGMTLSSGQRQRIAIARAAVRKAPILILDEPTSGLDEQNRRAVVQALARLSRRRTTLLVTHDLEHASTSDRILYLEQGKVAEQGSHDELMQRGGRYASTFELQRARGAARGEEISRAVP